MCELYKTYFSNGCYKGLNFKKKVKHKNINDILGILTFFPAK